MLTLMLALLVAVVALGFTTLALVLADHALVQDEVRRDAHDGQIARIEHREARRAAHEVMRRALGQEPTGYPVPDGSAVLAYWRA